MALQEMLAFLSDTVGHGDKHVGIPGGSLLKRMLGSQVELTGFGIGIGKAHRIILRKVIAGKAGTDDGRVSCEYGCDRQFRRLDIQQTGARIPLMELGDDLVGRAQVEPVETLYDMPCGIAEEHILLVVPVAGDRIHSETQPVLRQDVILLCEELFVVNQESDRTPGYIPSSDTDPYAFGSGLEPPLGIQMLVFGEIGIGGGIHPDIRSDKDVMSAQRLLHPEGFRCQGATYFSDFVADLPACFKEIIRFQKFFSHCIQILSGHHIGGFHRALGNSIIHSDDEIAEYVHIVDECLVRGVIRIESLVDFPVREEFRTHVVEMIALL